MKEVNFSLLFEAIFNSDRVDMVAGAGDSGDVQRQSKSREQGVLLFSLVSRFHPDQDPSTWEGVSTVKVSLTSATNGIEILSHSHS